MRANPVTGLADVYLPEEVIGRLDQLGEAGVDLLPIYEAVRSSEPPSQRGALWDSLGVDPARAKYPVMAADALHHLHRLLGPREEISVYYHLVHSMASTLWVEAYASFYERLLEDSRMMARTGAGARARRRAKRLLNEFSGAGPGENWEDVAPEAPTEAGVAAVLLSERISEMNDAVWIDELAEVARLADIAKRTGRYPTPGEEKNSTFYLKYAEKFGSSLAMMALGHGVSWFDDHAAFPLKYPSIDTLVDVGKDGDLFFECSGCRPR